MLDKPEFDTRQHFCGFMPFEAKMEMDMGDDRETSNAYQSYVIYAPRNRLKIDPETARNESSCSRSMHWKRIHNFDRNGFTDNCPLQEGIQISASCQTTPLKGRSRRAGNEPSAEFLELTLDPVVKSPRRMA